MTWIPTTADEQKEMLAAVGVSSIDDLFTTIPPELRLAGWDLPPGMSEMSVRARLDALAAKNCPGNICFMGGGVYDHFIPAAVDALSSRSEFYTAYTPYQPEAAQGTLQSIYEYQSAICRLTSMEVANASLYDGGTAVFEAATMSARLTKRTKILCLPSLNPVYKRMLLTHTANLNFNILDVPTEGFESQLDGAACLIAQNPSFHGDIADFSRAAEACHATGALLAVSFYPISLGLLKTPGLMGADIAIAEGQSLGMSPGFGGPYLGIMATRRAHMRKMPGRLVAQTQDGQGRRGFVLTLQAREQHIRRERAMSNICSNEALCALRALIYLCLLGKEGLREVAAQCHAKAEYLKGLLRETPGIEIVNKGPTFNEFVVRLPGPADRAAAQLLDRGFFAGVPLAALGAGGPNDLLVDVTEKRTRAELDVFANALGKLKWN
ncbi:MAG: aminomethyl-transferring glycine dehydrogenase subunit GcvPA [Candidatus Hydrogenedentes bacterium]|nr:aminomethyl-transferring glycine dehydrogenase subunit GcvPA [Candidatus Hydrogenedentota bacterium]